MTIQSNMSKGRIDLSLVSPSSVGYYGSCRKRLVYDTDIGKPYRSSPAADYGTVCHFYTMYELGCNPPVPDKFPAILAAAQTLFKSAAAFQSAVSDASARAIKDLPKLKPGVMWVCEHTQHDPNLLPERVSRKGARGFGGSLDLVASDRSVIVDLKFTNKVPKGSVAYLWQMASYYLVSGITRCELHWTLRDGSRSFIQVLDFTKPAAKAFADDVRSFIRHTAHADFRDTAIAVAGPHCEEWCSHTGHCFAYSPPEITAPSEGVDFMQDLDLSALEMLTASARMTDSTGKIFS